jgi:uncharacterized protein
LDGFGADHDATRKHASGKGTFAKIWAHLKAAADSRLDFSILLRIHFHPKNLEGLKNLLDAIKTQFGGDRRFRVLFKGLADLHSCGSSPVPVYSPQQQAKIQNELLTYLGGSLPGEIVDFAKPYMCYAAKPNSLVVRADGRLAKCTVALDSPYNHIGQLNSDGTLSLKAKRLQAWFKGLPEGDSKMLLCPNHFVFKKKTPQKVLARI